MEIKPGKIFDADRSISVSTLSKTLALGICGLSIGCLIGNTTTPNVQHVITSILTLLISIMSILAGVSLVKTTGKSTDEALNDTDNSQKNEKVADFFDSAYLKASISLWPVAGFMAGLLFGSSFGLVVRSNKLLGPNPRLLAWFWGVDRKLLMPNDSLVKIMPGEIKKSLGDSFLHNGSMSICGQDDVELLRSGLRNLDSTPVYQKMIEGASDSTLIHLRDDYCSKK